ncbi:hypothetical protein NLC29_03140 [Candidatus Aminicenantes bacterium AH-873-B07]|jgi:copper chaperone NosL|nr:hypothetical protein [Candidatus Aminicenantes bacterium AH-873-B07]
MKAKLSFIISGILIIISIFIPYILIIFSSPQYPTRSPKMFLFVHSLKGDIRDWEVVGRYIGVNVHPDFPELKYKLVAIFLFFLGLFLIFSAFRGIKWKKVASILVVVFGLLLLILVQFRLYQQGHNLDPNAPLRFVVKPFTPPVFGLTKISKIRIYHLPFIGTFLYLASSLLCVWSSWLSKEVKALSPQFMFLANEQESSLKRI